MERSTSPGNSFEEAAAGPPDATPVVGDADAVQKTTWVVGQGTNPNASDRDAVETTGETPAAADTPPMPRGTSGTGGTGGTGG